MHEWSGPSGYVSYSPALVSHNFFKESRLGNQCKEEEKIPKGKEDSLVTRLVSAGIPSNFSQAFKLPALVFFVYFHHRKTAQCEHPKSG